MWVDASHRSDDQWGHSVYAGILFAPPEIEKPVSRVREHVASPRATLPAHVTVLGTFCDVKSLADVEGAIAGALSGHKPVQVSFDGKGLNVHANWGGFDMVKSAELVAIYKSLIKAVEPLATNAYAYDEHGYTPHLTVWQECPPERASSGEKLGKALSLGKGFVATEVALVGREGTAYGGRWVTVRKFPLRG